MIHNLCCDTNSRFITCMIFFIHLQIGFIWITMLCLTTVRNHCRIRWRVFYRSCGKSVLSTLILRVKHEISPIVYWRLVLKWGSFWWTLILWSKCLVVMSICLLCWFCVESWTSIGWWYTGLGSDMTIDTTGNNDNNQYTDDNTNYRSNFYASSFIRVTVILKQILQEYKALLLL